jgi:hypothetical protein
MAGLRRATSPFFGGHGPIFDPPVLKENSRKNSTGTAVGLRTRVNEIYQKNIDSEQVSACDSKSMGIHGFF